MTPDRRAFLKRSAAVVSAAVLADGVEWSRAAGLSAQEPRAGTSPQPLDPDLLRAVGEATLPESLGPDGRERAVRAFELWWEAFEPNAELTHPYGGWVIAVGPPDREPEWSAQLVELDRAARARHDVRFADATVDQRRTLLAERITDAGDSFPRPAWAEHVAVALMAHYFGSADASNRCYGVEIDKLTCRSTESAGRVPPPLEG